ncbi:MAG: hemerythrin domain-containing protein [Bacteroidales bacterium]|jgi:regulator of cell morphogenesis and NO signaling|nr:hemerythrin domain-containing protein [Bacteroidales bacterium]MDD2205108.1 hemerythrin domain-containing protein [Bacteroidales bacterium]MDD3914590.1 hemerythrin domain-containing protein [Bacteroidales bacterium]MDD4634465.1 hemerythrin domain-containing protein [Bacteroidales bacterium]
MYHIYNYDDTDKMSDLIGDNYQMLFVISRFGIPLGFGDKSIGEVCKENNVDTKAFLAIVNLIANDDRADYQTDVSLSAKSIVEYLHNSHGYFLDYKLPKIREELMSAVDYGHSNVAVAIINYFDQYAAEVRKHMQYEEDVVFPYVMSLITDYKNKTSYAIDVFSKQHDQVEAKLSELKDILIKYYPSSSNIEISNVLFDIFTCAQDLASHNEIEDYILVPVIRNIELTKKLDDEK